MCVHLGSIAGTYLVETLRCVGAHAIECHRWSSARTHRKSTRETRRTRAFASHNVVVDIGFPTVEALIKDLGRRLVAESSGGRMHPRFVYAYAVNAGY